MLSEMDKKVILALQRDLEICPRPFVEAAEFLGIGEETLLAVIRSLMDRGYIRRFGATLRHQQSGYEANALVAWAVPEADLKRIAGAAAKRTKKPLTEGELWRRVGAAENKHKMRKHFDVVVADGKLAFSRKSESIEAEAALDGIYVIRTGEPPERLTAEDAQMFRNTLLWLSLLGATPRERSKRKFAVIIFLT